MRMEVAFRTGHPTHCLPLPSSVQLTSAHCTYVQWNFGHLSAWVCSGGCEGGMCVSGLVCVCGRVWSVVIIMCISVCKPQRVWKEGGACVYVCACVCVCMCACVRVRVRACK